jgi:hypothetical protein
MTSKWAGTLRQTLGGLCVLAATAAVGAYPKQCSATDPHGETSSSFSAHHVLPQSVGMKQNQKPLAKSGGSNIHGKPPEEEKDEEKKEEPGKETDTGIKVNGQTLWKDAKGNRYYYVNGDRNSPFISVEQENGSFKWSTKDAMLNPPEPGSYGQIGMIEHNGNLATMYQLPDGSRAFSDGESWLQANKGDTSFTRTEQISFQEGSNITNQGPGAGYKEPWTTGGRGSDPFAGQGKPDMFPSNNPPGGSESPFVKPVPRTGNEASQFAQHYAQLQADPTVDGARSFLKAGYLGQGDSDYRARIDSLSSSQVVDLTNAFLNETRSHSTQNSYSACPSCWAGAGGGSQLLNSMTP